MVISGTILMAAKFIQEDESVKELELQGKINKTSSQINYVKEGRVFGSFDCFIMLRAIEHCFNMLFTFVSIYYDCVVSLIEQKAGCA